MEANSLPAESLVERLLSNPALEGLSPLQKEERLLHFLQANAAALHPVLSSVRFFPGRSGGEILACLTRSLARATDAALVPSLERWVREELDLGFLEAIAARRLPEQAVRQELWELLGKILEEPAARRALAGPLAVVQARLAARYVQRFLTQERYICFELTKVERLHLGDAGTQALLAATVLIRPAIYLVTAPAGTVGGSAAAGVLTPGVLTPGQAAAALAALRSRFPALPPSLLRGAVSSNCSFAGDRRQAATARLAAIFAARGQDYTPRLRVDRGAVPPDTSWFSVARRNYARHGFDLAMLEELHGIAAENGW